MSSVHQPNVVAKDREQILTKKGQATRKGSACLGTGQRKHEEAETRQSPEKRERFPETIRG